MVRRLVAIIATVIAFVVMDRALAWGLGQLLEESGFRFVRLYHAPIDADVVAIGNSRGVNAFDARSLGAAVQGRAVNLAYNGMSPTIARALWEDYLERNRPPSVLLIEGTFIGTSDRLAPNLRFLTGRSERLDAILRRTDPRGFRMARLFHLYRMNGEMVLRALYYLGRDDQDWSNRGTIDAAFARTYRPGPQDQGQWETVDPVGLAAVRGMVAAAREHGVEVRVILSPYLPAYLAGVPGLPSWVQQLRRELGDDIVVDWTNLFTESSLFADPGHLNTRGTALLTERLVASGMVRPAASPQNP